MKPLFLLAAIALAGCTSAGPRYHTLTPKRTCAAHGYEYVVRTGPFEVYCLEWYANPEGEPQALRVGP